MNAFGRKKPLNRREALRMLAALGGMTAMSTFLEACTQAGLIPKAETPSAAATAQPGPPTGTRLPTQAAATQPPEDTPTAPDSTPTPTQTSGQSLAQVAFVKTRDRAGGVRKAIELLGVGSFAGKKVFLKPNFNSADPTPGSTHPDTLSTLVQMLQELGSGSITVGDRSGMGDTRQVLEARGVYKLADQLGFNVMVLDDLAAEDWVMVQGGSSHWERGFPIARPLVEAEAVVQTCCLKTHRFGGHFTLSLKNSVGLVAKRTPQDGYNYMTELHGSPDQRRMIAEINTAYKPDLVVLDGVEAFISGGPDQGKRAYSQVILAGVDRVAIDAVGVALLRYHGCKTEVARGKIFEQEQIARAVELGVGVDAPEKIELLTADGESEAYAEEIKRVLMGG